MIPPAKEQAPGGFNPLHFTVLCLGLLTLRVCFTSLAALCAADSNSFSMLALRALQDTCQGLGTLASHIFD